jgi:hypothetical protein
MRIALASSTTKEELRRPLLLANKNKSKQKAGGGVMSSTGSSSGTKDDDDDDDDRFSGIEDAEEEEDGDLPSSSTTLMDKAKHHLYLFAYIIDISLPDSFDTGAAGTRKKKKKMKRRVREDNGEHDEDDDDDGEWSPHCYLPPPVPFTSIIRDLMKMNDNESAADNNVWAKKIIEGKRGVHREKNNIVITVATTVTMLGCR